MQADLGRSVWETTTTKLVLLTSLRTQPQQPCNQRDTHFKICIKPVYRDRGPTANQSGGVVKIQHTNIKGDKKYVIQVLWHPLCSVHLEATSGPRSEEASTNNQRGRGSGSCLLCGGFDKACHIVPIVILVRVRRFRKCRHKDLEGPKTRPIVLSMTIGSYCRCWRRSNIFKPKEIKFAALLTRFLSL